MHLLNIQSSPRGPRSASIAVADAFLQAYRQACPELTVDTLNVWDENLPDFDQEAIGAKYKGVYKQPMDQAETAVWVKIQELAARFQQADRIVVGVPMWNFAYPYKLKQLIDLASQRNMLFTYDGTEYGPLLKTQGLRTTFSCVFEGFSRELSSHYIINNNCNALYSPITYRKVATM